MARAMGEVRSPGQARPPFGSGEATIGEPHAIGAKYTSFARLINLQYNLRSSSSISIICILYQAVWRQFGRMRSKARKSRSAGGFADRPSELGAVLSDLRKARRLSLREVEEAAGKTVSNAYLSQLENGRIGKPSPNVLFSLAEVYGVPYDALMEKAGYLLPAERGEGSRKRLKAFAIDDLTAEEEEELLRYLAFLRSRASA